MKAKAFKDESMLRYVTTDNAEFDDIYKALRHQWFLKFKDKAVAAGIELDEGAWRVMEELMRLHCHTPIENMH
jgi:hypothetical protein